MISLKENSETQSIYINVGKKEVNFYSMFPGRLVAREFKICIEEFVTKSDQRIAFSHKCVHLYMCKLNRYCLHPNFNH